MPLSFANPHWISWRETPKPFVRVARSGLRLPRVIRSSAWTLCNWWRFSKLPAIRIYLQAPSRLNIVKFCRLLRNVFVCNKFRFTVFLLAKSLIEVPIVLFDVIVRQAFETRRFVKCKKYRTFAFLQTCSFLKFKLIKSPISLMKVYLVLVSREITSRNHGRCVLERKECVFHLFIRYITRFNIGKYRTMILDYKAIKSTQ